MPTDSAAVQANYRRSTAQADADFRRKQIDESYNQALGELDNTARQSRRQLDTAVLSRGVLRSGETNRRRSDLEAGLLGARSAADAEREGQLGQVSLDLQKAMLAANLSGLGGSGGGGGGDGGAGDYMQALQQAAFQFPTLSGPSGPVSLAGVLQTGRNVAGAVRPRPTLGPPYNPTLGPVYKPTLGPAYPGPTVRSRSDGTRNR
jgi:hypothetical protein